MNRSGGLSCFETVGRLDAEYSTAYFLRMYTSVATECRHGVRECTPGRAVSRELLLMSSNESVSCDVYT